MPWLFISERGQPMTRQSVNYLVATAASACRSSAGPAHTRCAIPAALLSPKGHDLRLIQDYLGHRDPRHTVHYTRTAASRFDGLWRR